MIKWLSRAYFILHLKKKNIKKKFLTSLPFLHRLQIIHFDLKRSTLLTVGVQIFKEKFSEA